VFDDGLAVTINKARLDFLASLKIPYEGKRVLDAGCALNGHLSDTLTAQVWHLTQNIASETAYAHTSRPLSYVSADLRDLSVFAGCAFDRTVCVSTLEHVGMDNESYLGAKEFQPNTMFLAMKALCHVTRSELFVTVPYHEPMMHCDQWRFFDGLTLKHLRFLAKNFGFAVETRFYAQTVGGWYGGGKDPVPAYEAGFPHKVNAIACLRCTQ